MVTRFSQEVGGDRVGRKERKARAFILFIVQWFGLNGLIMIIMMVMNGVL